MNTKLGDGTRRNNLAGWWTSKNTGSATGSTLNAGTAGKTPRHGNWS